MSSIDSLILTNPDVNIIYLNDITKIRNLLIPTMYKSWDGPQKQHIGFNKDELINNDLSNNDLSNNNVLYIFDTWVYHHTIIY